MQRHEPDLVALAFNTKMHDALAADAAIEQGSEDGPTP
jgi:hypothetical protein